MIEMASEVSVVSGQERSPVHTIVLTIAWKAACHQCIPDPPLGQVIIMWPARVTLLLFAFQMDLETATNKLLGYL